jgi:hypothetical protein
VAALVQVAACRVDSLVALALVVGPPAVERALAATADRRPLVRYTEAGLTVERFRELDRLMRERSRGRLGSEV